MDFNDLHPAEDHSNRFFIWHEWIQANGMLTEENVFEYFTHSMFYDKQSNNQVLRMQTMHLGPVSVANEAEELRRFTGIEFAVVHAEPPTFFIIHKRERTSPDDVKPLAAYFILNNRVFQSPDLYSLLSNRLLSSVSALQTSLDILCKKRPAYTPRTGFIWPLTGEQTTDEAKKKEKEKDKGKAPELDEDVVNLETDTEAATSQAKPSGSASRDALVETGGGGEGEKRQNMSLLMNAMRTTAFHSKVVPPTANLPATAAESSAAETPATSQMRSSTTPGPSAQEAAIKGLNPTVAMDSKPKKRKKRSSLAVPPAAPS